MTRLYTAQWVLPVATPPIRDGAVAVQDGRILAVGPEMEVRARLARLGALETTALGQAALCPGFVNVHTHLELTAFRGRLENLAFFDWIRTLTRLRNERMSAEDLELSAQWGVVEAVRAGVTTVADVGASEAGFRALRQSGLRGVAYQEVFGPDPMQAKKSLAGLKRRIEAQRADETDLVRLGVSPHAVYSVSALLFRLVIEYAEHQGLPVAIHCAESQAEDDFLRSGQGPFAAFLRERGIAWTPPRTSPIRYLSDLNVLRVKPLLIHAVRATEEDIGLLTFYGASVAHCPKSNAKFGHGIAPVSRMRQRGVCVGLGTDSVASNNVCDLLDEGRFAQLLGRAAQGDGQLLSADALLRWMTLDGACALGLDDRIGTLEVGKDADLVGITLVGPHLEPVYDPVTAITTAATGRDVMLTVVQGRVIYDGQQVLTLDEARLQSRLPELVARLSPGTQDAG
ncbi:MAG: amidohydrolase family protein [Chloracidobacterium sp.]|nr:amidohydrolase family protein [Chloracidobacterium sp.]MDW8218739.1 amidohydrolase family protein [Acidobacteriota bacterium]